MLLDIKAFMEAHPQHYENSTQQFIRIALRRRKFDLGGPIFVCDMSAYGVSTKVVDYGQLALGKFTLRPETKAGERFIEMAADVLSDLNPKLENGSLVLHGSRSYADTVITLKSRFDKAKERIGSLSDVMVISIREDLIYKSYAKEAGFQIFIQPNNEVDSTSLDDGSRMIFKLGDFYVFPNDSHWVMGRESTNGQVKAVQRCDTLVDGLDRVIESLQLNDHSMEANSNEVLYPSDPKQIQAALSTAPY